MPNYKFSSLQLQILKSVRKFANNIYSEHTDIKIGGHGLDHAERVAGTAAYLSIKEKQNPFLPVLAALLHDIGRTSTDPRALNSLHGQLSKEICHNFLAELKLSKGDKKMVEYAIEDHPFLNDKVRKSYVSEILMDADRLDGLGAIGPIRAAAMNWKLPVMSEGKSSAEGKIKSIYGHFGIRMLEWVDMMWTESGKELAKERATFLRKYNSQLHEELELSEGNFLALELD